MLNTITARITRLLDVLLPAAMSAAFVSPLIYLVGSAATGLMA